MIELRIAEGCGPTGRLLQNLLRGQGCRVIPVTDFHEPGNATLCWGAGYRGNLPALNRNCGRYNKLEQLVKLQENNITTLDAFERAPGQQEVYPLIARRLRHVAGRDIRVCLQPSDAELAQRHFGMEFFTRFVPRHREYRVWVYRRRHLGSYEKILAHPERNRFFGCNYRNGWAFRLLAEHEIPRAAVELASAAVDALGLDFGAADVLLGTDGHFRILEVNTAPGVEGPDRQVIRSLARKVAKWEQLGYPRRNGDRRAD